MEKKQLSLGEAARLLGVQPYRIGYALSTGLVEEPTLRIANKRIFQRVDIQRLAQHFGVNRETQGECK
jgi:DNA-binding transcriptional MerR regulator